MDDVTDPWELHAGWWQEGFTDSADPEYTEQILPLAADLLAGYDRVLDVGTGEGQVGRVAAAGGASTTIGMDPAAAQVLEAAARGGGPAYLRAGADRMPFPDASFDAVVACLVFEHIEAVDDAISEVARVLRPGGRFAFFLNHPILQTPGSGWIDDQILDPPEQYWRIGPYLVESIQLEEVARDVFLPFVHRPLSRYVNAMADHGLILRRMHEPTPPEGFLARAAEYREVATIPRLLVLVAEREA
tara:strand:+ start:1077 stop:1811 length:735 start_codon:yes stop_codon:yes gene_type:complete